MQVLKLIPVSLSPLIKLYTLVDTYACNNQYMLGAGMQYSYIYGARNSLFDLRARYCYRDFGVSCQAW